MPLTLPPIPEAEPFAAFEPEVAIFHNSRAREIPDRLNAIARALKEHVNTLWLAAASGFVNQTMVANLNGAIAALENFANGLEARIDDQMAEFEVNLAGYLGTGAGYSVDAANAALFTGAIAPGDIEYDGAGRVASIRQGARRIQDITYFDDGTVAGYAETLTIGGVAFSRSFAFSYEPDGRLAAITEV